MPEFVKAVTRLVEDALGGPITWNGLTGEPWVYDDHRQTREIRVHGHASQPAVEVTLNVWEDVFEKSAELFREIINKIDWPRVLIEAVGLHCDRVEKDATHTKLENVTSDTCGRCVRDTLLREEH